MNVVINSEKIMKRFCTSDKSSVKSFNDLNPEQKCFPFEYAIDSDLNKYWTNIFFNKISLFPE